ncbi:hypothetical protein I4U23_010664 [Adineta vaga]|nr:hypothetical protein I4U23_010664 [Adineta vaga]
MALIVLAERRSSNEDDLSYVKKLARRFDNSNDHYIENNLNLRHISHNQDETKALAKQFYSLLKKRSTFDYKRSTITGRVKWFNDAKGFGFISQDNGGEDVFVHYTAIQMNGFRSLQEGQRVQFEIKKGPKGLQATNVRAL